MNISAILVAYLLLSQLSYFGLWNNEIVKIYNRQHHLTIIDTFAAMSTNETSLKNWLAMFDIKLELLVY